jgi:outer membrane protein TolC
VNFVLPAFMIGLASYIAVLEGLHLATKKQVYLRISTFWIRIFAVAFGMGVVSGIVLPSQLGANWSRYSDATANIVAPLMTYESLMAFFLIRSGVELAEAEQGSALAQYEKAIQTAFRDVSDALVQYQKVREIRAERELLVTALQDRKRLAYMRYRGGVDTLLNALDADRDLFDAELSLAQAGLDELLSLVQLHRALGGGWQ